ncbi:hypothetical protein N665_1940s0012 [Sinapis alba]|nr:hypothetical protein N665_1940s0012 [Sinapis alba]
MEIYASYSPYFSSSVDVIHLLNLPATSQDWPPIILKGLRLHQRGYDTAFFVKGYMEGVPIGRKLDLSIFSGYEGLLENLKHHVSTYQEKDGDWMVGYIPWDMFLKTVRRLRITRLERC